MIFLTTWFEMTLLQIKPDISCFAAVLETDAMQFTICSITIHKLQHSPREHQFCLLQDNTIVMRVFIRCLCWVLQRGDTGDKNANAKQKWFEEKQKRKHAELERLGLDKSDMHRIETAEQVRISNATVLILCFYACTCSWCSCSQVELL